MRYTVGLTLLAGLVASACSGDGHGEEALGDAVNLDDAFVKPSDGNKAPTLHKVGNKEVQVGQELSIQLAADDADSTELTFSVYGDMPDDAKFFKPEGRFAWTPIAAGGPYFVTFVVSDMKDFDSETVELRAVTLKTQHAPTFALLGDQFLKVNKMYELRLEASDEDGDTLYFSTKGALPTTATFDAENALFRWAPSAADAGAQVRVTFVVSDGSQAAEMEVRFIVEGGTTTNHPPEVVPIDPVTVEVGHALSLEVKATDPDNNPLTYSVQGALPDGASFDPATHVLKWTPGPVFTGKSVVVTFSVTDGTYAVNAEATILIKEKGAGCKDDQFEPNNKTTEATAVTQGQFPDLSICDTSLSPVDQDIFSLMLMSGEHVEVVITFSHSLGDLDLALFASTNLEVPVFYSPGVSDKEQVSYTAQVAGTYYLAVFGTGAGTYAVPYSMTITRSAGGGCTADTMEPNNTVAGAKLLDEGQTNGTPLGNLSICPSDVDVFAVLLSCGESLYAGASFTSSAGDLDLYLLAPDGQKVLDQSTTAQDNETVVLPGASAEDFYYVAVEGYPPETAQNSYVLEVLVEKGGACSGDVEEPNDGFGDPTVVSQTTTFNNLTVCCDQDWFSLPKGPGTVTVLIQSEETEKIDAAFEAPMAGSTPVKLQCPFSGCSGTQSLPASGGLYLRVGGTFGLQYTLTVTIDTTGQTTGSCVNKCDADGGGCWCDPMCTKYGDCCPDVCQACGVCS